MDKSKLLKIAVLWTFLLSSSGCTDFQSDFSKAVAGEGGNQTEEGSGIGTTPVEDSSPGDNEDPANIPPAVFPGAEVEIPSSVINGSKTCSSSRIAEALEYYQKLDPDGYQVYLENKTEFLKWFDECDSLPVTFGFALHETIHMVTDKIDAYPLLNGKSVPRVEWQNSPYYAPKELYQEFNSKDPGSEFINIYLSGTKAGSGNYFRYLLDEFNAYTHDARTGMRVHRMTPEGRDSNWRDGLTMMMSFVKAYARRAKKNHPKTWTQLNTKADKEIIGKLWRQAEVTLVQACPYTNFHTDKIYLQRLCDKSTNAALAEILGREPVCPQNCLDNY